MQAADPNKPWRARMESAVAGLDGMVAAPSINWARRRRRRVRPSRVSAAH